MTREKKQKIQLLIPLAIITGLMIYSWAMFLLTDIIATWRHYLALGLFAVLVYLYRKSFTKTIFATGLYLLFATFNAFSLTPQKITYSFEFQIGSIITPNFHFPLVPFVLLVLFLILNSDTLVNMYLDNKEAKAQRRKN